MRSTIGAVLFGLAGASTALAQSPAYTQMNSFAPYVPSPPPTLPALPTFVSQKPVGAQLTGMGVPMPQPPMLPTPTISADPSKPQTFVDVNAPYNEPYSAPIFNPADTFEDSGASCNGPKFWMTADYLFWWVQKAPQRDPLVVTGSPNDDFPGALDQPNTRTLYGGDGLGFNAFSGIRASIGMWSGRDSRYGFEVGSFLLEQKSNQFLASGGATGNPFLARPFINARTGNENVYFVSQNFADPARTALMTGGIDVSSNSRLWSWEANGLYNFWRGPNFAANAIAGFRSVGLREKLHISETLQNLDPAGGATFNGVPALPTERVLTFDRFDADNNFYGGTMGTRLSYQNGWFTLNFTGKASIGVMQQGVDVQGTTALQDSLGRLALVQYGGVLASGSNLGRHFQNKFAVIPEGNIDLGFEVTDNLILKFGYSFMFISSVMRPGNQVDRTLNPGTVPSDPEFGTVGGPNRPGFPFRTSTLWAQGVNLGLEFRY